MTGPPSVSHYSESPTFPYSTARPPTNYSAHSWVVPQSANGARHGRKRSSVPLLPTHTIERDDQTRANIVLKTPLSGSTRGGDYHTPLYARSSWASAYDRSGAVGAGPAVLDHSGADPYADPGTWAEAPTAWSRSSYAPAPHTARTHLSPRTALGTVYEEPSNVGLSQDNVPPHTAASEMPSARSKGDRHVRRSSAPIPRTAEVANPPHTRPRSIPSVLDIHQLSDAQTRLNQSEVRIQPALLSPSRQHQLGRMSVAPARYTVKDFPKMPSSAEGNPYRDPNIGWVEPISQTMQPTSELTLFEKARSSSVGLVYWSYRPLIWTIASMVAAMSLTLAMTGADESGTAWGSLVELGASALTQMPADAAGGAGLGVWGWCSVGQGSICKPYTSGSFSSGAVRIGDNDGLLENLGYLLTAQTTLTYLMGLYYLVTAFLQFFLLFGLSLPFDQFYSGDPLPPLRGIQNPAHAPCLTKTTPSDRHILQAEVNIRVRCERPPYETYLWVWWAWWGHHRGPLGHLLALICGLLGMCTLGVSIQFYRRVSSAAAEGTVSVGAGTLVALFAFLTTIDPFSTAILYMVQLKRNITDMLEPPSPNTGALQLPSMLQRRAQASRDRSIMAAPRQTLHLPPVRSSAREAQTLFNQREPPLVNPLDSVESVYEIDDETARWLHGYPHDQELQGIMTCIAKAAEGAESDTEFVLSDVGLLYIRPDVGTEIEQDPLLVPPVGIIRQEILEDAHVIEDQYDGRLHHLPNNDTLREVAQTYWWPSLEHDVFNLVKSCSQCTGGLDPFGDPTTHVEHERRQSGMYTEPTGVTGWTGLPTTRSRGDSAMAAEMAVAIRKAQEIDQFR